MNEMICEPFDMEALFSRPGSSWTRDEIDRVRVWLSQDRQYRYLIQFATFKLCREANIQDVEDAAQDLFANLWPIIRSYDPTKEKSLLFWNYLLTCFGRLCNRKNEGIWRRRRTEVPSVRQARDIGKDFTEIEIKSDELNPEETMIYEELTKIIRDCLQKLPFVYRQVLIQRNIDGLSTAEVAESLNISISLVKVRLHRAWKLLNDCLRKKGYKL